ncbi:MAG TPA: Xaa-Pro peptidase family protein [Steroidobacteraceae bacterium]|nr:Xaa-Pro peptidase family protein [Steroidobacteraceae bacterium]
MATTRLNRRELLKWSGATALAALPSARLFAQDSAITLKSMTGAVQPISKAEYLARLDKARALMGRHGFGALLIEPGASMVYFTGVHWWRSERPTVAVIPRDGDPVIVTPHFEEPSVRESLRIPAEVRVWNEHEKPMALVAGLLRDRKIRDALGLEETIRYFLVDQIGDAGLWTGQFRNAAEVVRGCRMIKSPAEIALMQKASDVTIAAYRHVYPRIKTGMSNHDISDMMAAAHTALGAEHEFALVLLGEASAYPHGSGRPQVVREGEVVLMDCGCTVEGYQSDISRTFVYGKASAEQRKVWQQMREGQQIAIDTARVGVAAGAVDDAVRRQYEKWGYGPGYQLPGLSHRTGHGIGLDGHEPVNLVHGEATKLAPNMCFSDEPGIYLPGRFGIRLEDCFYMGAEEPVWFSTPVDSLDKPFG